MSRPNSTDDTERTRTWYAQKRVKDYLRSQDFTGSVHALAVATVVSWAMGLADDGRTWLCFWSEKRIAKAARVSQKTVQRAMKELTSGPCPLFEQRLACKLTKGGVCISPRVKATVLIHDGHAYRAAHPVREGMKKTEPANVGGLPLVSNETDTEMIAPVVGSVPSNSGMVGEAPAAVRLVPSFRAMPSPVGASGRGRAAIKVYQDFVAGRLTQEEYEREEARLRATGSGV